MAQRILQLSALRTWFGSTLSRSVFMFTQGWLTGVAIHHPVFAFPIVTVVYGRCLHYSNMTFMDAIWRLGYWIVEAVVFCIYAIEKMTGGPTPNTLIVLMLIYGLVLCGLSSACGLAFVVWRSVVCSAQCFVYYGFTCPVNLTRSLDSAALSPPSVDSHELRTPPSLAPPSKLADAPLPDLINPPGCDSTAEPSSDVSSGGVLPPLRPVRQFPRMTKPMSAKRTWF